MSSLLFESDAKRFERNLHDARGFHLRAQQFASEQRRPSLIFNVASVAVENYLVAICAYFKVMPSNHNYRNLMEDAESVVAFDPALAAGIRALDSIFGICSLDDYHHGTPAAEDSTQVLAFCDGLLQMLETLTQNPILTTQEGNAHA